ncbi:AAA domain-containing protein [Methylicorpusculum oleiharenae]|uniref:AAA domain-containing protein n=1 Tax=Methylicorpusculum oleiharenae TaxID=1338687 RepID=UPI00135BD4E3|nr:AAA domain-containing protein [Methylicorpusculum oleiharenae]MCD2451067.1 AAA domain-containing protein [Methylicorpusculum oleiharenae]
MKSPHDLLKGLLEYIEEQTKDINPKAFRISSHSGFAKQSHQLAGLPGVDFDIRLEGDHLWLRIERLEAYPQPKIPDQLKEFLNVTNDPFQQPPTLEQYLAHLLNLRADAPDVLPIGKDVAKPGQEDWIEQEQDYFPTENIQESLDNQKDLNQEKLVFLEYLDKWNAWANSERPRRKSISLYGDLFALKHQIEAEETAKPQEFIWGVGISTWQIPFGEGTVNFEYPILTQAVELSIDEKSMALEVRPRATDTRVEMEAFVACSIPGAADVEHAIKDQLQRHKDRPVTPFDSSSYIDVLKLAASNLDSNGSFHELLSLGEVLPSMGKNLIVSDLWVLLSRPRSNNFLTEDLKRLKAKLAEGCEIPMGPLALVTPPSESPIEFEAIQFRGLSSRGLGQGKQEELYFPLPYNDEQVTIIQRLEKAAGVAVQGPPGTGKTHTIANVICHYLATGRRVLVTSRGETALEVLQSKIPEPVRALTVALMSSDREGVRQFQASIEAIQHQVTQLNPEQTRHAIATLESGIDRAHHELLSIDNRIDDIALTQLLEIEVDGIPMRAQNLAELVISGAESYCWFDDQITLSPEHSPPLTEIEAGILRESRRKIGPDLVYVQANVPSADSLPTIFDIAEVHEALSSMRLIEREVERGEIFQLKASTSNIIQAAKELYDLIESANLIVEELESVGEDWPFELRSKCRQAAFLSEREALESLFTEIDALIESRAAFLKRPVQISDPALENSKTKEAICRAVKTGKPFGALPFRNTEAKAHVSTIKISGLSPVSKDDWAHVYRYLILHEQLLSLTSRWNHFGNYLSLPFLEGGVTALRQMEIITTLVKKTHQLATEIDNQLPKKADSVFSSAPIESLLGGSSELKLIKSQLQRNLTKAELAKATAMLGVIHEKLAGKTGPVSIALKDFVEYQLGNPEIPSERVTAKYTELLAELRRIASLSVDFERIYELSKRIEQAGAPKFASRIRANPVDSFGEDLVLPVTWRNAWNWARMRTHLESIEARNELLSLAARRRDLESGLSRLYQDMVSKAAWLATKQNATPKILQALAGYATAIRRIGQGTGPNATRYRRDAREAMLDAANAVPCWIMNHTRISEAMPADIGTFDLVIVDEASQSDLWALPAILRGKKILVVGDDKQVSPDGGFIASQRILELKVRFLSAQPFGVEMTPEKSLYDLAARVFAAEQVMLREHFRCVPPIIAYSNRIFYKGGIQPLRIPKASERIAPPLVDVYVPDGYRDKHDHNKYEAEFIAEEIAAILENNAFIGRKIGVVSLLGMDQAKHIDAVVRERCDSAELLHREFKCGDARTFQGSERDIMFLSMVVDRNNCKALSGNTFDQRFNVATSRARDRMYLVRSVTENDLSEKDLRVSLLSHFNKPMITDKEETNVLIDQCESGFEREVFLILTSRGYRVIPQVKTGAYRIDMVVEGAGDNRLAIELDGDEFHGPDRWQHDMNRQRVLERAGWIFWRCFASTWSLRKDEVVGELIERLTAMGIEPMGAIEHVANLVEKRIWTPKLSDTDAENNQKLQESIELVAPSLGSA